MTLVCGLRERATIPVPQTPLPRPIGTRITSGSGTFLEDFPRHRADAGDQLGLVGRVDVATAAGDEFFFEVVAGLVEIAAVLDQLGSEILDRPVLVGVVSLGDDDRAADAEVPGRVGQRLTVIARRAAEDAGLPLGLRECADEVDPAADFERARRLVVLVL